jgi:hypothetical protein
MALEVQAAGRDRSFQRMNRRSRRAAARRDCAVRRSNDARDRLLESGRLSVAAHGRAHGLHPRRHGGRRARGRLRQDVGRGPTGGSGAGNAGAARKECAAVYSAGLLGNRAHVERP